MESCERNLKFVKEHLEICKNCERTFRKSKTLRLHIRQDHENESDDEGMNEDKTVEGEPDQQHEDPELDKNNDEEHKNQSCRREC